MSAVARAIILLSALFATAANAADARDGLTIASKRFTESYILGEIVAQTARSAGETQVVHRPGLGNTGIVFAALQAGSIDAYPEYTGTIARELLKSDASDLAAINRELAPLGLAAGIPFGFNNSYALAMREAEAAALAISAVSDLARHPGLTLGLSQEFLQREDGWPALRQAYDLPFTAPRAIDHGLAYEALVAGEIDVIDIYSTDAKIAEYDLRVLRDDRKVFPAYDAVLLYRADLPRRLPKTWAALQKLEGGIAAGRMIAMNAEAELGGIGFAQIAEKFLAGDRSGAGAPAKRRFIDLLFGPDFWRLTREHLVLVLVSLAAAVAAGIPLGVWAARSPQAASAILASVSVIQTIPSLALLAFLIPLLNRIGTLPALIALFLYSLLPIVRNTHSGLVSIAPGLLESARALGLPAFARLRLIELPLATPSIAAGIKTAAIISVGTATIAAFIGAGGYGERIAAGLAVNDNAILLSGAIPAAALALLIEGGFALVQRWWIPAGLRAA
ncbi:MAG: glycine betaine ABC transporter substrate-binding protein [Burkholderiales bacterium]|nr:ABC transporter permease subunit [Burkholderiales bacterium]